MLNLKLISILAMVIIFNSTFAQKLHFGVSAASNLTNKNLDQFLEKIHSEVFLELEDLAVEKLKLSFRLASNLFTPIEIGMGARYNFSWGPLGNILLKGSAEIDSEALIDVNASVEGVLASTLAAEIELMLFNVDKGHFDLKSAYSKTRPYYNQNKNQNNLVFGSSLGGKYRLNRTLILEIQPTLILTSSSLGGYVDANLHLRHLVDRDDGLVKLKAEKDPLTKNFYVAAGFEYRLSRRNWPTLYATVWLATGSRGTFPGGNLVLRQNLKKQSLRYELELAAETYRIDGLTYYGSALLAVGLEQGEINFRLLGAPNNKNLLPEVALQVSYSLFF